VTGTPATTSTAGVYTVEFSGGAVAQNNVTQLTATRDLLKGALDNGQLVTGSSTGSASFDASLYNGPGVVVITTRDGVATATVAPRDEGGVGLGVTTTTAGTGTNEVQELATGSVGSTTLSLTFNSTTQTGTVNSGAAAATVQSLLEGFTNIGAGNVTVGVNG